MKNTLISAGVAVLVVVLGFVFVPRVVNNTYGSASSPSVNGGCMDINGITTCYAVGNTLASTASTTCSIKNPAHATSTIAYGIFDIASTSASASYIGMGKSLLVDATTTSLATAAAVAANVTTSFVTTRTAAGGGALTEMLGPNDYFVTKIVGVAPPQVGGQCRLMVIKNR